MLMQDHLIKSIESAAYTIHTIQRSTNVSGWMRSQVDKITAPIRPDIAREDTFARDLMFTGRWAVNNKLSTFAFGAADYAIGHGKDVALQTPEQSAAVNVTDRSDDVLDSLSHTLSNPSSTGLLGGFVTMWTLPFAAAGGIAVGLAFAGVGAVGDVATKLRPSWGAKGEPYTVKAAALGATIGAAVSLLAVSVYLPVTVMVGSKALVVAFPMVALHGLRTGVTLAKAAVFAAGLVAAVPITLAHRAGSLMNLWTPQSQALDTQDTMSDETESVHGGMTEVDIDAAFASPTLSAHSDVPQSPEVDLEDAAGASQPVSPAPTPGRFGGYSHIVPASGISPAEAPPAGGVKATSQKFEGNAVQGLASSGSSYFSFKTAPESKSPPESPNK